MSLANLFSTGLPLNHKERFFTGTVFPQIVCADGGVHFGRFLDILGLGDLSVSWVPETADVQLFTEYSLVESIFTEEDKARFPNPPAEKFTPDIVILITGKVPRLIALEAKMLERPSQAELRLQMEQQDAVLSYLAARLGIPPESVVHAALLPKGLAQQLGDLPFPVITWDSLHARFVEGRGEDYFLNLLRVALNRWRKLKSVSWPPGTEPDEVLPGAEIAARHAEHSLPYDFVGRSGGSKGAAFAADVLSGAWRDRPYPLKAVPKPPNRNWFSVEAFVARVSETP